MFKIGDYVLDKKTNEKYRIYNKSNNETSSFCLITWYTKSNIYEEYDIFSKSIIILEKELITSTPIKVDKPFDL